MEIPDFRRQFQTLAAHVHDEPDIEKSTFLLGEGIVNALQTCREPNGSYNTTAVDLLIAEWRANLPLFARNVAVVSTGNTKRQPAEAAGSAR